MAMTDRMPPLGSSALGPRMAAAGGRPQTTNDTTGLSALPKLRRSETNINLQQKACRGGTPRRSTSMLTLPLIADAFLEKFAQQNVAKGSTPLGPEQCIRCMLRVPHKRCEAHKYIRVGGGYRHSYSYLKSIMGDLLMEITKDLYDREIQLQAIEESREGARTPALKALKTYIRTKSGNLLERIVFVTAEEYERFTNGGAKTAKDILAKYLTKDETDNLDSWDREEMKMIKTFVRTKSGKMKEKMVYISKTDYDQIKSGNMDVKEMVKVLNKYAKATEGETIDGWGEARMKEIKTTVRTKSGRIIEKTILVSQEEYDQLQKITSSGGDPSKILNKYMAKNEKVESWQKVPPPKPKKVIKTTIRTKSGRLVEKTVTMTEEEYKAFQEAGGDASLLQKFIKLEKGEEIESFDKASTVYDLDSDDEVVKKGKPGQRVVADDGNVYEVVIDEKTGKKYKKKLGAVNDFEDLDGVLAGGKVVRKVRADNSDDDEGGVGAGGKKKKKKKKTSGQDNGEDDDDSEGEDDEAGGTGKKTGKGKKGKGKKKGTSRGDGDSDSDQLDGEPLPSKEQIKKYKAMKEGKRNDNSDSEFSYRSVHSAGGTRKVLRKRKKADGTYSAEEEYNSADDEDGKARRRNRRRERKHGADSAHSYFSVVSAGGTRRVKRKKRLADGTYGVEEDYHSDESVKMKKAENKHKKRGQEKKKARVHGSDSEYSYRSAVSAGGTRTRIRQQRIRDANGKVIGHGKAAVYSSDSDSFESFVDKNGNRAIHKKASRKGQGDGVGGGRRDKGGRKREPIGKTRKDYKGGFSDQSTDTEDEPDLEAMTEEERKVYLQKKAERKAMRDQKRREKYGDKYDEVMAKHERNKKALRKERAIADGIDWDSDEYEKDPETFKQKYKSMVMYEKAADRGLTKKGQTDSRSLGPAHDDWSKGNKKVKKILKNDGNESDYESGDERYGQLKKKKGGKLAGKPGAGQLSDSDGESFTAADGTKKRIFKKGVDEVMESDYEYEIEYDSKGRIIKKKKKYHDGASGSEYEYEYDRKGNVISKTKTKEGNKAKKHVERDKFDKDDGNYFEKGADGKIKLRAGKQKIDIKKLSKKDLADLGIDPNMSKQDIARVLKEKFGDEIRIMEGGQKVGLKAMDDFASDANTDDLAGDSDLDTSTLEPGRRRVQILMRKGGNDLLAYMKKVVDDSELIARPLEPEMDASIDYIQAYRLVDQKLIDAYARAFVVEDEKKTGILSYQEAKVALEGISSIAGMTQKQIKYVMSVLDVQPHDNLSFRMFGVAAALSERITKMDTYCKDLLNVCDLADIERKLELYKEMFYCNNQGDRDPNYIKCEALMIELIAGGLSWQQQDYVMAQLKPNSWREVSFLDYLVYIPLFLSMHDGICGNPLDMSQTKYVQRTMSRQGGHKTRDLNPLGFPLNRKTSFLKQEAQDLLEGKREENDNARERNRRILHKYAKLPEIIGTIEKRPPGAPRYY